MGKNAGTEIIETQIQNPTEDHAVPEPSEEDLIIDNNLSIVSVIDKYLRLFPGVWHTFVEEDESITIDILAVYKGLPRGRGVVSEIKNNNSSTTN